MPVCYTVEEFFDALGYAPGRLAPHETITLSDAGQVIACDKLVGHIDPTERDVLEQSVARVANPMSPSTKRWLWIGGAVAAALLVGGGVAYARFRKSIEPEGPIPPQQAVDRAIGLLGTAREPEEIADAAYPMAYPDCPAKLDPEDPTHEQCIDYWWHLHDLAAERLPPPSERPRPHPDELPTEGPAADMRAWLESLTQHQRSELRRLIGPPYYNPIKRAAYDGDDGKTVAAVIRLKNSIEKLASDDPIEALKRYGELKDLLGSKLDELMDTAEKYG